MDSVFVNQGGDEIELRPLTARQYLSARLEAESLGGETNNDEIAKAVLLGAALLAKGAYVDGVQLFSNAEEALDSLTAQEIVETAAYIDITPEVIEAAAETVKKAARTDTPSEVGEAAGTVKWSAATEVDEAEDDSVRRAAAFIDSEPEVGDNAGTVKRSVMPEDTEDAPVKSDSKKYSGGEDKRNKPEWKEQNPTRRRYVKWDGGETYYGVSFSDKVSAPSAAPVRDDMRRVSDFFQRDSRRYDGTISNY